MAEHEGYIKIDRNMLRWRWVNSPTTGWLFIILLLKANYKKMTFEEIEIQPGQVVTSYPSLSSATGLSVQQCRSAIRRLKSTGEITAKTYARFQVITIVNYKQYQCSTGKSTEYQQGDSVTEVLKSKNPTSFSTGSSTGSEDVETEGGLIGSGSRWAKSQQGSQQDIEQASNRLSTGCQHQEKYKKRQERQERNKKGRSAPDSPSGRPERGTDEFRNQSHLLLTEDEGTDDDIPTTYRSMYSTFAEYWRYRNQ